MSTTIVEQLQVGIKQISIITGLLGILSLVIAILVDNSLLYYTLLITNILALFVVYIQERKNIEPSTFGLTRIIVTIINSVTVSYLLVVSLILGTSQLTLIIGLYLLIGVLYNKEFFAWLKGKVQFGIIAIAIFTGILSLISIVFGLVVDNIVFQYILLIINILLLVLLYVQKAKEYDLVTISFVRLLITFVNYFPVSILFVESSILSGSQRFFVVITYVSIGIYKNAEFLVWIKNQIQVGLKRASRIVIALSIILAILSVIIPNQIIKTLILDINLLGIIFLYLQDYDDMKSRKAQNLRFVTTLVNFAMLCIILASMGNKTFVTELIIFGAFYGMMALSLNISTGTLGVLNFGLIAQVAVGAVIMGITTVRGAPIIVGFILAILSSAIFSALLAISTLRLRDDYFAIVSITIGEIIRQFLRTEPSLRAVKDLQGRDYPTTPGILDIPQPFSNLYNRSTVPEYIYDVIDYRILLGLFGFLLLGVALWLSNRVLYSPYGRLIKSIREEDLVVSVHGKWVIKHKVIMMTFSGAIAGLAGAYMGWISVNLFPNNFSPIITFYVWTAFIIGGRGNNKGMVIGAIIFQTLFRASRFFDDPSNPIVSETNKLVQAVNPSAPPQISLGFLQLIIVGLALILFLRYSPRGILPEEPYEPDIDGKSLLPRGSQATDMEE